MPTNTIKGTLSIPIICIEVFISVDTESSDIIKETTFTKLKSLYKSTSKQEQQLTNAFMRAIKQRIKFSPNKPVQIKPKQINS
ncbi:hypothetical protein [Litorilituus sediminis]|uniref:Uncharacterized protein n=1 Tax=Litorilituus sediminis TaxID=718192 RepID=A0A4P6P5S4_9GAMM|nr:hypothetical protein [Litorilituus sediminis]QBG34742.1 hypothetical protein EMK97_02795 [Litorilituus sediminis]